MKLRLMGAAVAASLAMLVNGGVAEAATFETFADGKALAVTGKINEGDNAWLMQTFNASCQQRGYCPSVIWLDSPGGNLKAGIDMAYAYRPLHGDGVAHAFANTLLYLDLDRQGFEYPVLPVTVNCYGRDVIRNQGGGSQHADEPDPPAPSPRRCFDLGRATARIFKESPWRGVLMASSSWSHAFLTEKNHWLYPDLEADRALLRQLQAGDYDAWRDLPLEQLEASGQHEVLNWLCLAGAMAELDYKMHLVDWVETWIFNAPKCLALFR